MFPWRFTRSPGGHSPAFWVLHSWQMPPGSMAWRDPLLNVVMYIPVGLLAALQLRRRPPAVQLGLPVLLGGALSFFIEMAQVYDVSRHPSGIDLVTNTAGAFLGAVAALAVPRLFLGPLDWMGVRVERSPAASVLLALWLAEWMFPYIPLLSPTGILQKTGLLLTAPWPLTAVLSTCVTYAAVGFLLRELSRKHALIWLVVAVLIVPGQVALVGRQPALGQLLGALAGVGMFWLLKEQKHKMLWIAAAFGATLILRGLAPFRPRMSPAEFEWVPLIASFSIERTSAIYTLIEKCAWYSTFIWLLRHAGIRLKWAALGTAVMLAGIEAAQIWLPGRTPEITDPLIALAMAAVISILDSKAILRSKEDAGWKVSRKPN